MSLILRVNFAVVCLLFICSALAQAADNSLVSLNIPLLSETGQPAHKSKTLPLGGNDQNKVILRLNIEDIRHVLLHPDDLKEAELTVKLSGSPKGELSLYRLNKDADSIADVAASDVGSTPVATVTIDHAGTFQLHGSLGDSLNQDLKQPSAAHAYLLSLNGKEADLLPMPGPIPADGEHFASLSISITRYPNASLYSYPIKPTDGVYTKVVDGHLSYGDQRLRLWGVCRHFWGGPAVLDRISKMGFNAIRMWGPRNAYDQASAAQGVMTSDEGSLDSEDSLASFDKNFADAKQRGLFIWMAGLHYDPIGIMQKSKTDGLKAVETDNSFLAKKFGTGDDWTGWKQAMDAIWTKKARAPHLVSDLMYFDPRLKEIYRRQIVNLMNHVNPYTHKRYAEEEAVATWELNNEEGFVTTTLLYGIPDWPDYFKTEIQNQWNQWLKEKYHTNAALQQAWGGLHRDESIEDNGVKFAPMQKDRLSYSAVRAADLVHFCCDVTNSFNHEMHSLIRARAPAGVGAAVVPIIFDTQALPSAQWLYTNSFGDAVSFGNYTFTFHSSLTVPPGMLILDNQTPLGKPTLIYETEAMRQGPFRAEYPLRVAALASWQNWDGVFWHYWKGVGSQPDEGYQAAPLDMPGHSYPDGGIYPDEDPAFCAALSLAGQTFLHGAIAPAKNPVIHPIPPKAVYSYNDFTGENMRRDTFTKGALATFPTSDNVATPAKSPDNDSIHCGPQITYDWPNGRLIIDTPTMKAYVGQPHGSYQFSDGITVDHFSSPFVVFGMLSADGKPLAGADASNRIFITAQFDAKNTGLRMTPPPYRAGESVGWDQGWNESFAATIIDKGHAPTIADNIAFQLHFPTNLTGQLHEYDFALREKTKQTVSGNTITRDTPGIYMSVLNIESRGDSTTTPPTNAVASTDPQAPGAANPAEHPDPKMASLYMPLPNIGWGENYDAVLEYLRESTMLFSSISKPATQPSQQKSIKLTDAEAIFNAPAEIEASFSQQHLNRITATFNKMLPTDEVIHTYTTSFGSPEQNDGNYVTWTQKQNDATLTITLSQTNGHSTLTYEVH